MRALYAKMPELPPELQMSMEDSPAGPAAGRDRINCRQIVTRTVLALASGVTRMACWNLAPEIPGYRDRLNMMGFLFGKLALMDYDGTDITLRRPPADSFALVASYLHDASGVRRVDVDGHPDLHAYEVSRRSRGPVVVVWRAGDVLTGEEEPAVPVDRHWPHGGAHAVDAFGEHLPLGADGDRLRLPVPVTRFSSPAVPTSRCRPAYEAGPVRPVPERTSGAGQPPGSPAAHRVGGARRRSAGSLAGPFQGRLGG
ncbi:hypothetical protein [Streptomyces sp. NPDC059466]|uniref:hypothetical protein n=1 Tax=unclassified Streptomyces TaxID=2593676 RepID=UPI00369BDC42